VDVDLQAHGDLETLPDSHRTCVFRVIQEALTNCVRHSKARRISVTVTGHQDELAIAVRDDGVGFDPTQRRGGLGLRGIEERVKELAGTVTISGDAGKGTTLEIHVPVTAMTEVPLARAAG
jgi:signal transduction histidine kinase